MNKWLFFIFTIILTSIFGVVYIIQMNTSPAITYFPIDEETSFTYSDSTLELISEQGYDSYEIDWESNSQSDTQMYLRQDASLLFDNGRLRGVRSKWVQGTDTIHLKETLISEDSSFFQVISFHHGEVHYPNDEIKSIHQMSNDHLYVIDSPTTPLDAFKSAEDEFQIEWQILLDRTKKQQLLYHWHDLITHFNISADSYMSVPLTKLVRYGNEPLPSMTQEQTDKVIGRLWEGLYKNYIVPAANTESNELVSYVPIVLFDKEMEHLLVLFELNGKKEQLIQNYSF
ncbi:hypothetical protein J2Z83_003921 [Virgibacillus natechei]|uniref:DUF3919 family protein n=1 Tax=Virgibacillus natechei TaxID=1216297 RepID=A0ABS4IN92_9BACI|nr:hypothetical protein [Virgibacillus natechei]MBP1971766.1 hypothetical protein [Virgibacillus natechei]UZD11471.1 hypothetical protein OLD84_10885 [Virgibacillus natechei]